jgi:hypothetical protein
MDLEAIAIRVPRSRYWRDPAKVQATRRRNIAARQKQRLEVWKTKRRASWEPSKGGPACWYSRSLGDRLLCEPQFLWSLTEAGERARDLALLLE